MCMYVLEYMFIFCYLYIKIVNFKWLNYNIKKKDVNLDYLWKVVWYMYIVLNVEYCIYVWIIIIYVYWCMF